MFLKAPSTNSLLRPRQARPDDDNGSQNSALSETGFADGIGNSFDVSTLVSGSPAIASFSRFATRFGSATLLVNDTADHIINATEAAAVTFTVSGLQAGEAGTVTFSDASSHQVVVAVDGNGTFSANLSSLADGTITSLLAATDPHSTGTSAIGNPVSLDTDSSLTPSLSVDATIPSHVTFTVVGLEGDETGTVTFTDSLGVQDVAPIESNGAYSANLSNLADGTITYLLRVTDPAGNVITVDPPLNLGDGSANAPSGSPQMPSLLSGYAVRPAWNVAGVDYAVGVQSGITLKDPLTGALPAGVTRDATNHTFTITGNNVVLSGWNFSLEGGWGVQVVGNNDTISNNYFKIGANAVDPINTGGSDIHSVTIVNNVIDGSGIKPSLNVGLIWLLDQGTSTIEYNLIENAYTTDIQESISGSHGSASQAGQIIQYNVIANTGLGYTIDGSHGDFVQDFGVAQAGSTQVFNNIQVNYNTLIENNPLSFGQGLSILTAAGNINTYALQESVQNNTVVLSNTGGIAYGIGIIDTTWLTGTATFANNYVDPTGANYGPYFIGQYNGAGQNPTNGATSVGSNLLHFSSTAQPFWQDNSVSAGELVYDITNPSAIPVGTTVTSVGATTVTLSANATGSGVANGDSIRFGDGAASGAVSTFNNINMLTGAGYTQNVTSVTQVVTNPSSGTEIPGNTVALTLDFSAAVTVTGAPTLKFNDGGTATYVGGSGTNALTFTYTVGASDTSVPSLAITQVNLPGGATIKDGSGNAANLSNALTTFWNLAIDPPPGPTPISIIESPSTGDLNAGNTVTLTLNLSSAVTVAGGTPTLTLNDGGIATYTGGSGSNALTFSYTVGSGQNTASLAATAVNLNGATIKDGSGNAASLSLSGLTQTGPQIDTTTPSVASLVASGTGITAGAGDLCVGSLVTLTVNLSEAVTVTGGTPTLTLNDGGTASYTGGSGTNALSFSYTVGAGQNTADLAVTAFNQGTATITNGAGTAANLSGAVTNPSGTLQIDTTTPAVSSVATSGTGITAGTGDVGLGSVVTLTVNLSEAVTVAGGTSTLTLNDGGTATYAGGSGTSALTFSYTVGAGQNTADLSVTAVNPGTATITNGAGTAANLSGAVTTPAGTLQIDTTIPTVTQVVASPGSGTENPGAVITLTVDLSKAVTVTGTPTLTLNDGAKATYTGGSGTNALTFSYTVATTDSTVPTLAVTQVNLPSGATVKDAAGNAANLSGAVTTFPGLSIDPPPVVVSIAETPSTGDLNAGKTVTLTLQLNDVVTVTGGTPTLTLNDGGTATYTGGNGTNALSFSYTVGAGDNTASLAATAVNLNGATVQNSLGDAAVLLVNGLTQTGPQIDTTAPTVSSVVTSGTGITSGTGDLPAGSVVTLTLNLSSAVTVAGGTPTLTLNDGGTATYTGGSGSSALTFSYTVGLGQDTADLAVTAVNLGTATVKDGAGNAANFSGAVTNPAGTLQIDTTTHLTQVGNDYFLYNVSGSGPELKYHGAPVVAGQFAPYVPVGAMQTATGYEVALEDAGANSFSIWNTDSNGNFLSYAVYSGASTALESLETSFHQDLNGDGTTGVVTQVISAFGSTSLTEVGNNYFLDSISSGTGPELKYNGAPVTAGQFAPYVPVGVFQTATGYEVALENASANSFSIWNTDSSGNFQSFAVYSGTSTALESLETSFHQDLNGDGTTGVVTKVISAFGSTELVEVGNNYFLDSISSGTGPELKYNGAPVVAGQFAPYVPVGVFQTATGYEVALENASANSFSIWNTDSSGNFQSFAVYSGTSTALESLETSFHQDLNGDGTTGVVTQVISAFGSTSLTEVGNNYFLDSISSGTGPELKYNGALVTAGQFGSYVPVGVFQTATGYEVALENASANSFSIWNTDGNGNFQSFAVYSGTSTALESLETSFHQDLNGDGTVGAVTRVMSAFGSTELVEVGNNYFLDSISSGTGPELKFNGAPVVAGQFAPYVPVGVFQTATGYEVALENASANSFSIWNTDSNGNFLSYAVYSGNSTALESLENSFQQDLNGDGVIGIYAAPSTTLQINSSLSGPSGSATIGTGATLELSAADSASVTFSSSTGMLKLDTPSTFSGTIFNFTGNGTLSGSDQIDLKGVNFNSVQDTYANGVLTVTDGTHTDKLDFNGSYTLANFKFASDGSGGTIVYDPPVPAGQGGSVPAVVMNDPAGGQGGSVPAVIMNDPAASALNQQLALFSQHMASAFPSSAFGNDGATIVSPAELTGVSQIAQPIANQQHA